MKQLLETAEDLAPAIIVCGVDFGWGSAGKLSAILRQLASLYRHHLQIIVLGTTLGKPLLEDLPVTTWYERYPLEVDRLKDILQHHSVLAGLVILDPEVAMALELAGCPVVYVDSLPYLWTEKDVIPYNVTVYAAQLCENISQSTWHLLQQIPKLVWVEGITLAPQSCHRHPKNGLAVVSFGGLHSPLSTNSNTAYERLILMPTICALLKAGFTHLEICGNVHSTVHDITHLAMTYKAAIHIASRSHSQFLDLLDDAELLVCSPGLTTVVEASSRSLPTVCLPPQNLSQIFNGNRFAACVDARCRVTWPQDILDLAAVERVQTLGEEAAVSFIYESLDRASVHALYVWDILEQQLSAAIEQAQWVENWQGLVSFTGTGGAWQVTALIRDLIELKQRESKELQLAMEGIR